MHLPDIQRLLAELGWYTGALDGDAGPQTLAAMRMAEAGHAELYASAPSTWPEGRRLVGAGQVALVLLGFEPGPVDGFCGASTREALIAWRHHQTGQKTEVPRRPMPVQRSHPAQEATPRQADLEAIYGPPGGPRCTAGRVSLPYPMRLAWDLDTQIGSFACHELVATPLTAIFQDTLDAYGREAVRQLGLDLFGGCFNHRKMRGGAALSTHAWGVAVDLDPARNQLRWRADRAQFARPEYATFWQIVMAHGATPAGYAWGADWMHFQFARL